MFCLNNIFYCKFIYFSEISVQCCQCQITKANQWSQTKCIGRDFKLESNLLFHSFFYFFRDIDLDITYYTSLSCNCTISFCFFFNFVAMLLYDAFSIRFCSFFVGLLPFIYSKNVKCESWEQFIINPCKEFHMLWFFFLFGSSCLLILFIIIWADDL